MAARPAHPRYRSATSSCVTSRASSAALSDDEDAITPAGPVVVAAAEETRHSSSSKAGRRKRRAVSPADSNPDVPSFNLDDGVGFCYLDAHHNNKRDAASSASDPLAADMDSLSLWRRMLTVQRVFGCYNSARISAALDDETLQSRVPSRACLDLLNDSIAHLPEDEREQVEYFIEHGKMKPSRNRRSLWGSLA